MPLQGVWTADNDSLPPWKGDYHHDTNTQLSYQAYLKANHLEEGKVFVVDCYTANNGAGMVVTVKTKSFGGLLTEMIGMDAEGNITGVKVTAHGDTPGLGTKAHDAGYLAQYAGLNSYTSTSAKADAGVTHVTGATVSSDAVHYGVCAALEQYKLVGGAN